MSEFEKWSADTWVIKPLHEIIAEYNALHTAWQESQAELERIGKINNSMCDTIAELEKQLHEIIMAELESRHAPIRVPFTDAQIEAMARAANDAYSNFWISKDWPKIDFPREQHWKMWDKEGDTMKESRIVMIRAAPARLPRPHAGRDAGRARTLAETPDVPAQATRGDQLTGKAAACCTAGRVVHAHGGVE